MNTAKKVGGWKADSIFTRYDIISDEDLQDTVEKVSKYEEAESQKIVTIGANQR